jgi:hypothetical protein
LLVTKIISTHAGRGEKLEHRRNDPPLGDERAIEWSARVQLAKMLKTVRDRSLSD